MILSVIVAMAQNRVIGKNNLLPWHLPEDLKHFRDITRGHTVIMGRKTYESVGRPLPQRTNVIITRNKNYKPELDRAFEKMGAGERELFQKEETGKQPTVVRVVSTLDEALADYRKTKEEVFVIGGSEIIKMAMDQIDKIYLTVIHQNFDGDVFLPEFDMSKYKEVKREDHAEPIPFSFIDYSRK